MRDELVSGTAGEHDLAALAYPDRQGLTQPVNPLLRGLLGELGVLADVVNVELLGVSQRWLDKHDLAPAQTAVLFTAYLLPEETIFSYF